MRQRCITIAYKMDFNTIEEIVTTYESLPRQGSTAWLNRPFVGGSELAALLGKNKYRPIYKFVCEKLRLTDPEDDEHINLQWGNVFEPIHTEILEHMLMTDVRELPSIPWQPSKRGADLLARSDLQISPDGIAYVNKYHLKRIIASHNYDKYIVDTLVGELNNIVGDRVTILIEQKACVNRGPTTIPEYYKPQIESGMNLFTNINLGLFTESVFRLCNINTIVSNDAGVIDTSHFCISADQSRRNVNTMPGCQNVKVAGISFIYCTDESFNDNIRSIGGANDNGTPYIIQSIADASTFIRCAKRMKRDRGNFMIHTTYLTKDNGDCINKIAPTIASMRLLMTLPWKLFNLTQHYLLPNRSYVPKIFPIVKMFRELITSTPIDKYDNAAKLAFAKMVTEKIREAVQVTGITLSPCIY